jgi:hypothetical protein
MMVEAAEPTDGESDAATPNLIDTTAELLGRAKPRKPRARAPRPIAAAAPKKAAAKKPAARRSARGKKGPVAEDAGNR